MNGEEFLRQLSHVDEGLIREAETVVPIRGKSRPIKRWIAVAACACLLVVGCSVPILPGGKPLSPLTLTAYAIGEDGSPLSNAMTTTKAEPISVWETVLASPRDIPVSVFSVDSATSAFVFSYPHADMREKPHITTVYSPACEAHTDLGCVSIAYWGDFVYAKAGMVYVYYIFQEESESYDFTYRTIPNADGTTYEVSVSVYQKGGNYRARVNSITKAEENGEAAATGTLDEKLAPYRAVLDKLNAENHWYLTIDEDEKQAFYDAYRQYSPDEFEKLITEELKQKTHDETIARLKKNHPECFALSHDNGMEVYVWQMAEKAYRCGLTAKKDGGTTEEEIRALQFQSLSVDEVRVLLEEWDVDPKDVTVIATAQPYSSYAYVIDDDYRARVAELFE